MMFTLRPRKPTSPPPSFCSLIFLKSIDTGKENMFLLPHFLTFQPSTTAQSIQRNNFIFHTRFFYPHVNAEFLYELKISIISIIKLHTNRLRNLTCILWSLFALFDLNTEKIMNPRLNMLCFKHREVSV